MNNRVLIVVGLLLVKCSTTEIAESQIKKEFLKEFPTYTLESFSTLGRTGDSLRIAIKFRKPTDRKTWVDHWVYVLTDSNWTLIKTGKRNIINPIGPIDRTTEKNAMLQILPRYIKIDSIIYSADTFPVNLYTELVLKALYKGKEITEPTFIPEGDSIILIYQRHLGNLTAKNHRPK